MFRSRSWFGGGWGRPKNPHSIEHLKYLYNVLSRNQTVSEHNRGLLVETLRSIAEILIWGDQNDSSVFDFFLEKNMLSFFLRIMRQRSGGSNFVCVQLLQTLNILFENIRNETSLYYLLSNNHVNSIIVHKFDFSDEEVMAYYISFLKTLSLKLNAHTIHFFYNEHTNDFPLYTEAIKFFNHPESMVRIAVRTLTLNVYKVEDSSMLGFIRDRTAAPYFSNIVWFIGKHVQELDNCVRNDADHQSQNRLSDLVAEHLDHLHYLNDILLLNITDLNRVLADQLLNKLLIPLYIYSLTSSSSTRRGVNNLTENLCKNFDQNVVLGEFPSNGASALLETNGGGGGGGKVSCVVAFFLLSQVFLIISHQPLVPILAWIVLMTDRRAYQEGVEKLLGNYENYRKSLGEGAGGQMEVASNTSSSGSRENLVEEQQQQQQKNITDEEKERLATTPMTEASNVAVTDKPFLEIVYNALDCNENDYAVLFALCLLYAIANNEGVTSDLLELVLRPKKVLVSKRCTSSPSQTAKDIKYSYNTYLVEKLLQIVVLACQPSCRIRLVTLELALKLIVQLVTCDGKNIMNESHRASLEAARSQSTALLRNFYKSEEIFLDMFEHEYCDMSKGPLNVEWLCMDSAILLPPTGTPMTGIDFTKRLPCGEVERARRAIRVFFLVRNAVLTLNGEMETELPLTNPQSCVQIDAALDLNNSDLIACTVVGKDGQKIRRFLVIDVMQLILVEPDTKRLGWGVAKLVGFLQDIEVAGDKDDSRCLHITIHRPLSNTSVNQRAPLLSAKFIFDDNIRCMAAKQRLSKGRIKARQKKMQHIARLLDIPGQTGPPSPAYVGAGGLHHQHHHCRGVGGGSRLLFHPGRLPGFAARRDNIVPPPSQSGVVHRTDEALAIRTRSPSGRRTTGTGGGGAVARRETSTTPTTNRSREPSTGRNRSREGSPRMPRPRSEEIPLELIKLSRNNSNNNNSGGGTDVELMPPKISNVGVAAAAACSTSGSSKTEGGGTDCGKVTKLSSKETSFIAQQNDVVIGEERTRANSSDGGGGGGNSTSNNNKNKGFIETI